MKAFSTGQVHVMVATDIAARRIDVSGVELVVHVDPPAEHKAYLHRSGRTARAGSAGDVVTVVLPEQRKDLAVLMRKAAIKVTPQQVTADSDPVNALVGEIAPHVVPTARPTTQPTNHGGGQRRSGGGGRGAQGGRGGQAGRGGSTQGSRGGSAQGGGRGRSQSAGHGSAQGGSRGGQTSRAAAPRTAAPRTAAPTGAGGGGNSRRRRATRP